MRENSRTNPSLDTNVCLSLNMIKMIKNMTAEIGIYADFVGLPKKDMTLSPSEQWKIGQGLACID